MERAAANVRRNQLLKLLCTTPKNVLAIQWENVGRQKKTKQTTTRTSGQLRPKQKEEKQWRKAGT
jgi:hypothetical protein